MALFKDRQDYSDFCAEHGVIPCPACGCCELTDGHCSGECDEDCHTFESLRLDVDAEGLTDE